MKAYADSSFLVSLYIQQRHTTAAADFMKEYGVALPFTPWHRVEVRNAIRLAAFRGAIDSHQSKTQLKQVEFDLREASMIVHAPIDWISALHEAEKIGAAHNEVIGCRTGDLFHIAAAIKWGADHFLTFDDRQKRMAVTVGLST